MNFRAWLLAYLAVPAVLFQPTRSVAVPSDAQSLGLAGASGTRRDSYTAWTSNPGISLDTRIDPYELQAGAGLIINSTERMWKPLDPEEPSMQARPEDGSPPGLTGFAAIRGFVPGTRFIISMGWFATTDDLIAFPTTRGSAITTSPLRFASIKTRYTKQSASMAVSRVFLDGRISIGAGGSLDRVTLRHKRHLSAFPQEEDPRPFEDTTWDMPVSVYMKDRWVPRCSLGALVNPFSTLDIGLAASIRRGARLSGRIDAQPPAGDPLAGFSGDNKATATLPWELEIIGSAAVSAGRFHFAVEITHVLRRKKPVEIHADEFNFRRGLTDGLNPWESMPFPFPFPQSSTRLSAATEIALIKRMFFLRTGFSALRSSMLQNPEEFSLNPVSPRKNLSNLATAGIAIHFERTRIDLGYGYGFSRETFTPMQPPPPYPFGIEPPMIPATTRKTSSHTAAFTISRAFSL